MRKKTNGITLIALVITVIILLILAGTAIAISINGDSLFSKASDAKNSWNEKVQAEETEVNNLLNILDKVGKPTPGLYYAGTEEMVMTWEKLIDSENHMLTYNNGSLGRSTFDTDSIFGSNKKFKLVIDDSVTQFYLSGISQIEELIIPDSVTQIDEYSYLPGLKHVEFGKGITTFPKSLIVGATQMEELIIPDNITEIYVNSSNPLPNSLKYINFGNGITEIPNSMCYAFQSLEKVVLGNKVTSIGASAFNYCIKLKEINLPSTLTTISSSAFIDCHKLSDTNIIPESVTTLGTSDMFKRCTSFKSVKIGENINKIPMQTFESCTNLEKVYISKSVTKIENMAFGSCMALTDVYYDGSETEWNNIEIERNNDYLINATIHCNSTF